MQNLEHKLRRMKVEKTSATLPRDARLSDAALAQAESLHEEGRFAEAACFLQDQGAAFAESDPWAANAIGLSYSQAGLEKQAWPFFEAAERAAMRRAAYAAHNLAVSFKKVRHYTEALEAAERSRRLAPERWPIYLVLAAVYECRASAGDRAAAISCLREMTTACPDYDRGEVVRYLANDLDYADLKNDRELDEVFSEPSD